jgi:hypothetical protein
MRSKAEYECQTYPNFNQINFPRQKVATAILVIQICASRNSTVQFSKIKNKYLNLVMKTYGTSEIFGIIVFLRHIANFFEDLFSLNLRCLLF